MKTILDKHWIFLLIISILLLSCAKKKMAKKIINTWTIDSHTVNYMDAFVSGLGNYSYNIEFKEDNIFIEKYDTTIAAQSVTISNYGIWKITDKNHITLTGDSGLIMMNTHVFTEQEFSFGIDREWSNPNTAFVDDLGLNIGDGAEGQWNFIHF